MFSDRVTDPHRATDRRHTASAGFLRPADARQTAIDHRKAEMAKGRDALAFLQQLHGDGRKPATGKPAPAEGGDEIFDDLDIATADDPDGWAGEALP